MGLCFAGFVFSTFRRELSRAVGIARFKSVSEPRPNRTIQCHEAEKLGSSKLFFLQQQNLNRRTLFSKPKPEPEPDLSVKTVKTANWKLSCTRLRVPPVALHVSQLISWIL